MAKYNFTVVGGLLQVVLDTESGVFKPEIHSYNGASTMFGNEQIYLSEFGNFRQQFYLHNIGTIGGVAPTSIENANVLIGVLITTASGNSSGGGSVTQYNATEAYDTVANLPITFPANTIHSISVLSKTGNTVMTINGEQITLEVGQTYNDKADGLISTVTVINSCTGAFIATVKKP
jgi:hypothetical protein